MQARLLRNETRTGWTLHSAEAGCGFRDSDRCPSSFETRTSARLPPCAAPRYIPAVDTSDLPALQQGIALLREGRIAQAESCFRDALRAQPDAPELHATLGAILAAQGRASEALPSFHAALRLRPDSADAHGNLGN